MCPFSQALSGRIRAFLYPTGRFFYQIADPCYPTSGQNSIGEPDLRRSFTAKQGITARTWCTLILQVEAVQRCRWRAR